MPSRRGRLQRICAPVAVGGSAAASTATPAPALTPAQRDDFDSSGFLILPGAVSGPELAKFRALASGLVERASTLEEPLSSEAGYSFSLESHEGTIVPGFLHKVQGVNTCQVEFNEIARHPSVLPVVQELLGSPELDIFGTKFFPKLPATSALPTGGISVNWHQDNFAFGDDVQADRAKQERIISLAIYLDDSDHENGCFQLVPGSHRHGFLPPPAPVSQNSAGLQPQDLALPDGADPLEGPLPVPCAAGTVVLFSANLLHSALPNRSDRSRYGLFWHYLPRDFQPANFLSGGYSDRHEL